MILGILIFLIGMGAISVIIEHFPMTPGAVIVWGHQPLAFRYMGKFFGKETHVSIPPPYIQYGKTVLRKGSVDYVAGRLDITYLSENYDVEEWHGIRGKRYATADEDIEIGDLVMIHNGVATVVKPAEKTICV